MLTDWLMAFLAGTTSGGLPGGPLVAAVDWDSLDTL